MKGNMEASTSTFIADPNDYADEMAECIDFISLARERERAA